MKRRMSRIRENNCLLILSVTVAVWAVSPMYAADRSYRYLYENLPFEMTELKRPIFPDYRVSVDEFGGVPDGVTLNTEAFASAMSALASRGGGSLIVPSGIWLTGPIEFRSNVNLHLEKGAVIIFSPDYDLYPLVRTSFEGLETYRCQSPVSGRNLENIAITGQGIINGSGEAWRPLKKVKVTEAHWDKVVKSGGALSNPGLWFPTERALRGDTLFNRGKQPATAEDWMSIRDYLRPVMVSFIECKNILLEGALFENSPGWNLHPLMCENLIIDNIVVRNPSYAQNGDGLDIESCRNVIVVNSSFDVGDDAICIKSGKDEDGRRRARPTENVIVENCKVFKGHGGFVVGSEMSGGVRNVSVSNCQFMGTNIGLRFKSARGRGGVVENIYVDNINMFDMQHEPISFDLYYFTKKTDKAPEADETTPAFRNINIRNIVAKNSNKAMFINGLPEMNISGIHLENVFITAKFGAELSEVENVRFENVAIYPETGSALHLNNVKNMLVSEMKYPAEMKNPVVINGERTENIRIRKPEENSQQ